MAPRSPVPALFLLHVYVMSCVTQQVDDAVLSMCALFLPRAHACRGRPRGTREGLGSLQRLGIMGSRGPCVSRGSLRHACR